MAAECRRVRHPEEVIAVRATQKKQMANKERVTVTRTPGWRLKRCVANPLALPLLILFGFMGRAEPSAPAPAEAQS